MRRVLQASNGKLGTVMLFSVLSLLFPGPVQAQSRFYEDFDGRFSQVWYADPGSLPDIPLLPFRGSVVQHIGPPASEFTRVGDTQVLRMDTRLAMSWSSYGYVSETILTMPIGKVEARINTLDQGGGYIDGLFALWLINADDPTQYVVVGLFGDLFDTQRSWFYATSLTDFSTSETDPTRLPAFRYTNHTWYQVRIDQKSGENLTVSILQEDGALFTTHTFDHPLESLGSAFRLGFGQWMGGPPRTYSLLCALNYIHVKTRLLR
jgi:hypothetical protein